MHHFLFNQHVTIVYCELGCALKHVKYCLSLFDAGMDLRLSMTSLSSCNLFRKYQENIFNMCIEGKTRKSEVSMKMDENKRNVFFQRAVFIINFQ